jgi:hypothetical protein
MDMRGSITFEWKMFRIPAHASLYSLVCGLIEMLVLGVLYGLTLTVHYSHDHDALGLGGNGLPSPGEELYAAVEPSFQMRYDI